MKQIISIIVCVVVVFVAGIMFAYTLNIGLNQNEIRECKEWEKQAEEYQAVFGGKDKHLFYLTKWQADQCEAHGIIINAPLID